MLGIKATVVIPSHAPAIKIQAVRDLGAEVVLCEKPQRFAIAEKLQQERGYCYVPPFDDYGVMAGQGTIALEIFQDMTNPDAVVIPIGGGGLTSGIATTVKAIRPQTKVYACEPALIPRFTASLKAGHPVTVPQVDTIADGVATLRPGDKTFPIVRDKVDEVLDIPEEALLPAMKLLLTEGLGIAGRTFFLHRSRRHSMRQPTLPRKKSRIRSFRRQFGPFFNPVIIRIGSLF